MKKQKKDTTPLLCNMKSALNKSLGAKNTKELNGSAEYYMGEITKIVSNEIKKKHSEKFSKKFSTENETDKYIQELVKK